MLYEWSEHTFLVNMALELDRPKKHGEIKETRAPTFCLT
jgi:hypothetical protein